MSGSPHQASFNPYSPHADAYQSPPLGSAAAYPPLSTTDPYAPAEHGSPPSRLNRSDSHLHAWSIPDGHGFNGSDEALRSSRSPSGDRSKERLSELPGGPSSPRAGRGPNRGRLGEMFAVYNTPNQLSFMSVIGIQTVVVLAMIGAVYQTIRAVSDHALGPAHSREHQRWGAQPTGPLLNVLLMRPLFV